MELALLGPAASQLPAPLALITIALRVPPQLRSRTLAIDAVRRLNDGALDGAMGIVRVSTSDGRPSTSDEIIVRANEKELWSTLLRLFHKRTRFMASARIAEPLATAAVGTAVAMDRA